MRASKENAEKAIVIGHRLRSDQRITQKQIMFLQDFLKAAKAKLPSEAAFDADAKRKRSKRIHSKNV